MFALNSGCSPFFLQFLFLIEWHLKNRSSEQSLVPLLVLLFFYFDNCTEVHVHHYAESKGTLDIVKTANYSALSMPI